MWYRDEHEGCLMPLTLIALILLLSCNDPAPAPVPAPQAVVEIGYAVGDTVRVWLGCGSSCWGVVREMYETRLFVDFPDSCTGADYPIDFYQDNWYPWWHVKRKVWDQQ